MTPSKKRPQKRNSSKRESSLATRLTVKEMQELLQETRVLVEAAYAHGKQCGRAQVDVPLNMTELIIANAWELPFHGKLALGERIYLHLLVDSL